MHCHPKEGKPVGATVRWLMDGLSLLVGHRVVDGVLNGGDLFSVFIRDLDTEFVFQGHHQFNRVQRVGAQIGHKGLFAGDLTLFHARSPGLDLPVWLYYLGVPLFSVSVFLGVYRDAVRRLRQTGRPGAA